MDDKQFADQYRDQGYLTADDAVEQDLLEELVAAASRVVAKVRSGERDSASNSGL